MRINDDTLVVTLTIGQLREAFATQQKEPEKVEQPKRYVYGLKGIRDLFQVSHATAQKYKNTFLSDAVSQQGRKIIVDVEKAMELFNKAGK